jgi:hypothetical protein
VTVALLGKATTLARLERAIGHVANV